MEFCEMAAEGRVFETCKEHSSAEASIPVLKTAYSVLVQRLPFALFNAVEELLQTAYSVLKPEPPSLTLQYITIRIMVEYTITIRQGEATAA